MICSCVIVIGFIVVFFWSFLVFFMVGFVFVLFLQFNVICFGIGGSFGFIWIYFNGGFGQLYKICWFVYVFGMLGIFGYYVFYFLVLCFVFVVEVGFIVYFWLFLIVLFFGFLSGEYLCCGYMFGGIFGFVGVVLIIFGGDVNFFLEDLSGFVFVIVCVLIWLSFLVLL